jgi:uncharacterized protein YgbK (DUF1537 family)
MRRMLIIADDLSGAADCASACAGTALSAVVALSSEFDRGTADVLSVDADTRNLEPTAAAHRMAQVLRRYGGGKDLFLFKKLDSTLRGNIGHELAAILEVRRELSSTDQSNERIVAIVAPAFPAGGRTTVKGQQLVHGRPLHESEIWQHQNETRPADIATMLQMAGMRSAVVSLDVVRSGNDHLRRAMKEIAGSADALVCDAETDSDLRAIADASLILGRDTIWAGSAGLASQLPYAGGLATTASSLAIAPLSAGPTLLVIGSMSSVSRQQVELLASSEDVRVFSLPTGVLLEGERSRFWSGQTRSVEMALHEGRDVIVVLEKTDRIDSTMSALLCNALGTMTSPLAESVGALIASGGETARAVLQGWGVSALRMIGEVEAGVPFSVTEGWGKTIPVITKAGAFGHPNTLLNCWNFLRHLKRNIPFAPPNLKGIR